MQGLVKLCHICRVIVARINSMYSNGLVAFSRAAWSYAKHRFGLVQLGNVECCVVGINNMF